MFIFLFVFLFVCNKLPIHLSVTVGLSAVSIWDRCTIKSHAAALFVVVVFLLPLAMKVLVVL